MTSAPLAAGFEVAQQFPRGPMPVFDKRDLHGLHDRSGTAQMRIAPMAERRVAAQIFPTDIQSAHPGLATVDHDDFAMVAEVDLETIGGALRGVEGAHLDAGRVQRVEIIAWQPAADLVVKQMTTHPGPGALHQHIAQPAADLVVADDVELHQRVVARAGDAVEDRHKHGFAIDEQLHVVEPCGGQFGELRNHRETLPFVVGINRKIAGAQGGFEVVPEGVEIGAMGAPRRDVAIKVTPTENPVGWHRDIGKGIERNGPGHGALRGACFHQGMDRREKTEEMRDGDEGRQHRPR